MFNLPLILIQTKIQINDFFIRSVSERNELSPDVGFCNMEIPLPFKNLELPSFSDRQNNQFYIKDLKDYYNWKDQIEQLIISEDKNSRGWFNKKICSRGDKKAETDKDKKFEVEHSYVDFQ